MPSEIFSMKYFCQKNDENFHVNYLELKLMLTKIKVMTVFDIEIFGGVRFDLSQAKLHQQQNFPDLCQALCQDYSDREAWSDEKKNGSTL